MSTSEFLATHNRHHPWVTKDGRNVPVMDLSTDHIKAIIQALELRLRKMSGFHATHPRRKHEGRSQYHLKVMKAELEWRTRNGL